MICDDVEDYILQLDLINRLRRAIRIRMNGEILPRCRYRIDAHRRADPFPGQRFALRIFQYKIQPEVSVDLCTIERGDLIARHMRRERVGEGDERRGGSEGC